MPEMYPDPPVPSAVHVGRRRPIEVRREVRLWRRKAHYF
ncbi:hypothetical protein LINGRAHAP2_LOCUS26229 [Linum grandiflorum]